MRPCKFLPTKSQVDTAKKKIFTVSKYVCVGTCKRQILGERSIICDGCGGFSHARCAVRATGAGFKSYSQAMAASPWFCPAMACQRQGRRAPQATSASPSPPIRHQPVFEASPQVFPPLHGPKKSPTPSSPDLFFTPSQSITPPRLPPLSPLASPSPPPSLESDASALHALELLMPQEVAQVEMNLDM
jgi:hypothetical protein